MFGAGISLTSATTGGVAADVVTAANNVLVTASSADATGGLVSFSASGAMTANVAGAYSLSALAGFNSFTGAASQDAAPVCIWVDPARALGKSAKFGPWDCAHWLPNCCPPRCRGCSARR